MILAMGSEHEREDTLDELLWAMRMRVGEEIPEQNRLIVSSESDLIPNQT